MFEYAPVVTLGALWVAAHVVTEWAWRAGRRRANGNGDDVSVEPATALLAVLGLLLAFTVSMAVDRFDARKQLVIDEANAIGTAELRSHLLPETARAETHRLFADYVDRRVRWGEGRGDSAAQATRLREAAVIQTRLWQIATEAATATPTPVMALYQASLNSVFDIATERSYVRANRVPETILLVLTVTILIADGLFAGVLGRKRRQGRLGLHLLAFSTWLVVALIVDLDRPRGGWVQVGQEPLVQLQDTWRDPAPMKH